jgi:hypothetical protein
LCPDARDGVVLDNETGVRRGIARASAVVLIVLAASPFTAPFSTCDLAAVNPVHQGSDTLSAAKISQDTTVIAFQPSSLVADSRAMVLQRFSSAATIEVQQTPSFVLRL